MIAPIDYGRRRFITRILGGTLSALGARIALATEPSRIERGPTAGVRRSIDLAIRWLLRQQEADGGWHSATYGPMRSGVGNTALVLYALGQAPEATRNSLRPQIESGISFLMAHLQEQDSTFDFDDSADHPTYSAALLLATLNRMHPKDWGKERKHLRSYLLSEQRRNLSIKLNEGGWGAFRGSFRGDANISATRFALEALQPELNHDAKVAAIRFISHCQNFGPTGDGGCVFTPVLNDPLNKAGQVKLSETQMPGRSYGTATADGLCALIACGTPPDDPRVQAAIAWLDKHGSLDYVPGFPEDDSGVPSFREGLRYYYYAALANAMRQLPDARFSERRGALLETVVRLQRENGAWKNSCTLMKEDDPLIATALSVAALSVASDGNDTLEPN